MTNLNFCLVYQVAFLAAMAGPEVAETASKAAVAALSEFELSSINNGNDGNIGLNNQEIEEASMQYRLPCIYYMP